MASWRELAARLTSDDRRGEHAATPPEPGAPALPGDLWEHLLTLENLPPPPLLQERLKWRPVVADAMRIAREGWAERALGLGWTPADLFGVGEAGSDDFEGLAVWLRGRRIILLDATTAISPNDDNSRAVFNRPDRRLRSAGVVVVPLWKFGRRQS